MNYLEHFNCEGCEKLSDKAFKYLLESKKNSKPSCSKTASLQGELEKDKSSCQSCHDNNKNSIEDIHKPNKNERLLPQQGTSLKYINLSGCWSITDSGLE